MKTFTLLVIVAVMRVTSPAVALSQIVRRPSNFDKFNLELLPPYMESNGLDSVVRYDFTDTMTDGVVLDCLKYIPINPPPLGGWRTVIMCHGFGDSKETLAGFCKAQAEYGYYTMTYSMRGQGNSGGLCNLISTIEMKDLINIISYVKRDTASGSDPNNILIMGGSQGGVIPFMAACNGAKVNAIISALSPPNFASSWIENGSIKMTLLWSLTYTPDSVRYTPAVKRYTSWIYADNKEKWDSLSYWLPQGRDFMNKVSNCSVPIIVEGTWQDKFFNASGIMQAAQNLDVAHEMYIGAVIGHGGDSSYTESLWHMNFFNDWFYRWLFSSISTVPDTPVYQYASTSLPYLGYAWTFVHGESRVWPPSGISNIRFYFNGNNRLTSTPDGVPGDNLILHNSVTGNLTMQEAVDDEFTGSDFNSKFIKDTLRFDSDPLPESIQWIGTPMIKMNYSSSAGPFCQYDFQVYEVKPDGTSQFINRLNYTDRNYTANTNKTVSFYGQAHSHIFQTGDRIRIILTNLDTAPTDSTFLATNSFVLPVLINENNKLYLNSNFYIEIPGRIQSYSQPLNTAYLNVPYSFKLQQNYPNPFNPTTTIQYNISISVHVSLKVYDITGKEVKVLKDEIQTPGTYKVTFEGTNFASGIYFYELSAGSFHEVRRMVLVK